MSDNGMLSGIVAPEDAMLRMGQEGTEATEARQHMTNEVKARLTLSPKTHRFVSTGTSTIQWQVGGEWQELEIPIRSLTPQTLEMISDRHNQDIKPLPKKWDEESKQYVPDELAPEAMEWLIQADRIAVASRYDKIVCAFDGDLESEDGRIVWSSIKPGLQDLDAAVEVFKALEIPSDQLNKLAQDIDNLSVKTAVDDLEEFKKKQPQP